MPSPAYTSRRTRKVISSSAERRAKETIDFTAKAAGSHDLAEIKRNIALASQATNAEDTFGVKESIVMAVNHITFAATSDDATLNVQKAAPDLCVRFGTGDRAMRPDRALEQGRAGEHV